MADCSNCGYSLPENVYFCPKCATPVPQAQTPKAPNLFFHKLLANVFCRLMVVYFLLLLIFGIKKMIDLDKMGTLSEAFKTAGILCSIVTAIFLIFTFTVRKTVLRRKKGAVVKVCIMFILPTVLNIVNGYIYRGILSPELDPMAGIAPYMTFSIIACVLTIAYFIWKRKIYTYK